MPVNIYNSDNSERVAWLSDDSWELPTQIDDLETWLIENQHTLPTGKYVADVGFDIRKDACGGGAVLSTKSMEIMAKLGIELFLSEYPDTE
ncbi:hypothetical protein D1814_04945 [Alteromonas sp. BL110]|uniref:hypothetical protein n=1 Tax=unclassified Alteromonas TaxID=2614992 RepID=UPI00044E0287|nr:MULTISPECIES: hypothetical protein [unclassified Alteromonas]AXT38064.1 hypothetical protein D1814_04945 [Alteromonas sp. BL110]RKM80806.1 hypothetical protein D7031_18290 [Alteromonas sp. BL110]